VNDQRYIYQGYTLVDITPTGQTTYSPERELARNQQRNWETVLQILGLRTQTEILFTEIFQDDVKNHSPNFGINYTGQHKIWTFKFAVDYAEIYRDGADAYGLLKSDFKITPIILNLSETARPELPIFYTSGPWKNVYFNQVTT
jgi:hypothetical protein